MSTTRSYVGRTTNGARIWVNIKIKDTTNGPRLSITGEGQSKGRREIDFYGQILNDVADVVDFRDSRWTPQDVVSLLAIWEAHNLNDTVPGCAHQMADGWADAPIDPSKPTDTYGVHFDGQQFASWNLLGWIRPDEHPDGLLGRPCETCGYRYGTAWQYVAIPEDVMTEVARLQSL